MFPVNWGIIVLGIVAFAIAFYLEYKHRKKLKEASASESQEDA